jgi:hypothetical protein
MRSDLHSTTDMEWNVQRRNSYDTYAEAVKPAAKVLDLMKIKHGAEYDIGVTQKWSPYTSNKYVT